jgi:mono/diheme cytochrome c family protein
MRSRPSETRHGVLLVAAVAWAWLGALDLPAGSPGSSVRTRAALKVLQQECFACHGDAKRKGGLSLSSRESILQGGDEGPAGVPGKPDQSRLLTLVQPGADPHMPPKKQLDPDQLRLLRDWIRSGMPWDQAFLDEEDAPEPVTLSPLPPGLAPALGVALSPQGDRVAVGQGALLTLHDLTRTNGPVFVQPEAHPEGIQSVTWSPDGKIVATGGFRRIRFWDADTGNPHGEWTNGLVGRIQALAFAPDGGTLAVADGVEGRAGRVRLIAWQDPSRRPVSWKAHADAVFDLEFSADGSRLVTAGGDHRVRVWNPATREEVASLEGHTAQVFAAAFNTNATQVVSGGADRQIKVWDIATREKLVTLGNPASGVPGVAWPADSSTVFTASESGAVHRYTQLKSHSGEQSSATADEKHLGDLAGGAVCLSASTNGARIAVGGQDGSVRVWDREGKLLGSWSGVSNRPSASVGLSLGRGSSKPPRAKASANQGALKSSNVVSVQVEPAEIVLTGDAASQGVVVTATLRDGFEVDATPRARFSVGRGSPVRIEPTGRIVAVHPGQGSVTVRAAGREVEVPVTVRDSLADRPVPGFVRDVLPALSQAGCLSGGCHSKPEGQNGFKLTVFSYDPRADHEEIVREGRQRRVFPAAPDQSLLLRKALGLVPHEGGRRFAVGSETHQLLERWIRAGMPFAAPSEPVLEEVTIFPSERRYRRGASQTFLVMARYSDGSRRDVTALTALESNDPETVRIDGPGRATVGALGGEAVVVARYMGRVAAAQVLVPSETVFPPERYAALPRNNFIDDHAYGRFQRLGLLPSDLCTDAEFLRRSKLDAVGLLPTPEEVREFLADPAPDKRSRWITRLLDHPAYGDYWANKWADLLRPNPDRVGVKSVFTLDQWLREQFRDNRPYDAFVRDVLQAEGSNHRNGPAVVYRDRREPAELTTMFSQLFLGTRLECAKCHHHPNEKWGQEDFYQLAAFFGPVKQKGAGLSPPISAGIESFYYAAGGEVRHPVTGAVMTPRPPDGPDLAKGAGDPRDRLAGWLLDPKNPFFAKAAVNRVWANFFGRGLVHPVDDFRTSNPCVQPELLEALAADFASHGYDFKHLIRVILESRLYQLSTVPNETNLTDTRRFSRGYRRRLPAEVLMDAVRDVTGVSDALSAMPEGSRAMQAWSYKIGSHFLDAFGRPNSSSDCPCERDLQLSVVQSLHLMNSQTVQSKLSDPKGRVRQLTAGERPPREIVVALYLAALGREPGASELSIALKAFEASGATRETASEDLLWALLNSPEFVFNH